MRPLLQLDAFPLIHRVIQLSKKVGCHLTVSTLTASRRPRWRCFASRQDFKRTMVYLFRINMVNAVDKTIKICYKIKWINVFSLNKTITVELPLKARQGIIDLSEWNESSPRRIHGTETARKRRKILQQVPRQSLRSFHFEKSECVFCSQ